MNYHSKRKPIHPAVVVAVLLLALAILIAAIFLGNAHRAKENVVAEQSNGLIYDTAAIEGGWDNLSPEEIAAKLNEKVAEGMINISMNTAPYFESGDAEGNLMIVNEAINNYPQQVEIVRNDTDELVYKSGAIPVGSKIERAKLMVELEAGTYDCTAFFHNLDPDTGNILGTAGAVISITIKN